MPYIAYFDLLGTKELCDNSDGYFENMNKFYEIVIHKSEVFDTYGKVGVFSDCAYVESNDLQLMLDFLSRTFEELLVNGIFMSCALQEGTLRIVFNNGADPERLSAIKFDSPDIAKLYLAQSKFKGIGIHIDPNLEEKVRKAGYNVTKCVFIDRVERHNSIEFIPVVYTDLMLLESRYGEKSIAQTAERVYRSMYSAYVKSPRYGAYYISVLSNMIRSYCKNLKWNMHDQKFSSDSVVANSILNMLNSSNELRDFPCLEYLALVLLDEIYICGKFDDSEMHSITRMVVSIERVNRYFVHSLTEIPRELFHISNKFNCREYFIQICQDDLSAAFIDKLME